MSSTTLSPIADISGASTTAGSGVWTIDGNSTAWQALTDGSSSSYIIASGALPGSITAVEKLGTPTDPTFSVATAVAVNLSADTSNSKASGPITVQIYQSDGATPLTTSASTGSLTTSEVGYTITLTLSGTQTLAAWTNAQLWITASNPSAKAVEANVSVTYTGGSPPSAPTGLSATAASSSSVNLSWTNPTGTLTDDKVQYSTDDATWTTIDVGSVATSYTVTGLSANTLYYFQVAAVNSSGTGSYCTAVTATTYPAAPGAPTSLTVANDATNPTTALDLSWTASSGSPTSYTIQRTSSLGGTFSTLATGVTGTTYVDSTCGPGTEYAYKVAGVNGGGTGTYSTPVAYATEPAAPGSLAATPASTSQLNVTWRPPSLGSTIAIANYVLHYRITGGGSFTSDNVGNATSYSLTGLAAGTSYDLEIQAVVESNNSDWSGTLAGVTSGVVSASTTAVSPLAGYATTSARGAGTWYVGNDNPVFLKGYTSAATGEPITDAEPLFTVFLSAGVGPGGGLIVGQPISAALTNVLMTYVPNFGYQGTVPGTAGLTNGSWYYVFVKVANYDDCFQGWYQAVTRSS